jgi:hypothetical protein
LLDKTTDLENNTPQSMLVSQVPSSENSCKQGVIIHEKQCLLSNTPAKPKRSKCLKYSLIYLGLVAAAFLSEKLFVRPMTTSAEKPPTTSYGSGRLVTYVVGTSDKINNHQQQDDNLAQAYSALQNENQKLRESLTSVDVVTL